MPNTPFTPFSSGQPFDATNPRDPFNVAQLGIQGLKSVGNQAGALSMQMFDPTSQYFQQARSYLASAMPQIGTNALLAPLMAQGSSYGSGQAVAKEQRAAMERRRSEAINQGTKGIFLGSQQTGANLLGLAGQTASNIGQIGSSFRDSQVAASAQEGSAWDLLAPIGGAVTAGLLTPVTGGASLAAAPALMASDIRLKENIKFIEKKGKYNIYEFNFIGNPNKTRGVMAQEVQKITPEAVVEHNGTLYVDYSKLEV